MIGFNLFVFIFFVRIALVKIISEKRKVVVNISHSCWPYLLDDRF